MTTRSPTPAGGAPPTSCDQLPINLSGAIQAAGFLMVIDYRQTKVMQVSANIDRFLGVAAPAMVRRPVEDFFSRSLIARWLRAARATRHSKLRECVAWEPPLSAQGTSNRAMALQFVCHFAADRLIVEAVPGKREENDPHKIYAHLMHNISSIAASNDIDAICNLTAQYVRDVTGFDRAMVYRFDSDRHGEVIAEAVNSRTKPRFLGLHFPASDVPQQVRAMYTSQRMRSIYDVKAAPVPLVPQVDAGSGQATDLGGSILRSVPHTHRQYLQNMEVRASYSVSILVNNQLWGLIACHHEREARMLSQAQQHNTLVAASVVATQVARINSTNYNALTLRVRGLMDDISYAVRSGTKMLAAIANKHMELQQLFNVDSIYLKVRGLEYGSHLVSPSEREISVIENLARGGMLVTDCVSALAPALAHSKMAGIVFVALAPDGNDYLLMQRAEQVRYVNWGGNPEEAVTEGPIGKLRPRASFETWKQEVRGKSAAFADHERQSLAVLRHALIECQAVEEKRIADESLIKEANIDSLTQLPNRHYFMKELRWMFESGGTKTRQFALAFIDLDNFKHVNDTLGHPVGDKLLVQVAKRFRKIFHADEFIARLSGDEFTVIIRQEVLDAQLRQLAERVLDALAKPFELEGNRFYIGASIGLATSIKDGGDPASLMRSADLAMYEAKRRGKNRFVFFTASLNDKMRDRVSLQTELRDALARHEFVYHLQPIVNGVNRQIVSAEALVRWDHPQRGVLYPHSFHSIAEEISLMSRIDAHGIFSLHDTLERAKHIDADFRLSLNVSGVAFQDNTFEQILERAAQENIDLSSVNFEITESVLVDNPARAEELLNEVAKRGSRIYIDDFGTGYSSLSYLYRFPVSGLKIDRSFVNLMEVKRVNKLLKAIAAMAESLVVDVVAEGIETAQQAEELVDMGIVKHQGFFYSRGDLQRDFLHHLTQGVC